MATSSSPGNLIDAVRGTLFAWGFSRGVPLSLALLNLGFAMAVGVLVAHPLGSGALPTAVAAAATSAVVGSAIVAFISRTPFEFTSPASSVAVLYAALAAELARQPGATLGSIWISLSLTVVLMGLLLLVSARLRLADAVRFLPAPVSAGFISGIGLLVAWSQVGPLLGITGPLKGLSVQDFWAAIRPGAVMVGCVAAAVFVLYDRFKLPGPANVIAVLTGMAVHHLASAAGFEVGPTLGSIYPVTTQIATATAMMSTSLDAVQSTLRIVLPYVAFLVLQALMSAAVVSSAAASIAGQVVDVHRNVRAQGFANIACGLMGAMPVCTNATITLVAAQQRSRWQEVASSCLVLFCIVFLVGGLLAYVPIAALAGMLVMVGLSLVDRWARRLARNAVRTRGRNRMVMSNLLVVTAVIASFLLGSVPLALFIGSVLAMVLLAVNLSRSTRTTVEDASRLTSTRIWPPEQAAWLAQNRGSITIVRPRGGLFFGTAEQLGRAMASVAPGQTHCIVDMEKITTLDASGCQLLSASALRLNGRGTRTLIAGYEAHTPEGRTMVALGLEHPVEQDWLPDMDHALEHAEADLLRQAGMDTEGVFMLAGTPLTDGMDDADAAELRSLLISREVAPGRLFASGDIARSMFLVERGRVEISVHNEHAGKTTRLASFGRGSVFGEISLLSTGVRTADAWCVGPCQLLEFTREALDALGRDHPRLHAQVLRNLSVHLANRLVIATAIIEAQQ
ncbi:SulP family inorganic anion transporter [Hydrogenophaga sp.]|uniref:SulP family inorganic anion transporter n=1 Tax=Hydrogenophaga sp. TaxID=1904254 RepID=UPI003F70A31B